MKMIQNLNHLLVGREIAKLVLELDRNVIELFKLGESHFGFAASLDNQHWRQKISRLYYGAYNVRRAVILKFNGSFSTDLSDHKNVEQLPDSIQRKESHINNLRNLREDRNLADYSHLAILTDLVISPDDALAFVTQFIADCRQYLLDQGVNV